MGGFLFKINLKLRICTIQYVVFFQFLFSIKNLKTIILAKENFT